MSSLEIIATILTVACVLLANFRSTIQYPIGIAGTVVFFFAVWQQHLYANAALQVFFTVVQLYGWWYWLRGGVNRTRPPVTRFGVNETILFGGLAVFFSIIGGQILNHYTNAKMPTLDTIVFGLSVLAQFLLDRKKIENWIVWGVVNVASVYLYWTAGLPIFAILYLGLFINTFIAYRMWTVPDTNDTGLAGPAAELVETEVETLNGGLYPSRDSGSMF